MSISIPRKRHVWVHIGPPKTGTSSLQHCLAHNRKVLRGLGILYPAVRPDGGVMSEPDPGEPSGVKHDYLLLLCMKDPSTTTIHNRLSRSGHDVGLATKRCEQSLYEELEGSSCDQVLFSSEAFGNLLKTNPDEATRLVDYVKQFADRVTFVIYVRHPLHHARSHQQHLVKSGYRSLSAADVPFRFPFVDVIERLVTMVGPDDVQVRRYGRDFDSAFDVVADFADTVGFDHARLARPKFHGNRGLSMASALLIDSLHRQLELDDDPSARLTGGSRRSPIPHNIGSSPFRLSSDVESQILKASKGDLEALATVYGVSFPHIAESPVDVWDQETLDDLSWHMHQTALRTSSATRVRRPAQT